MLSCANKSLVYAPISRLRRSFAGIRKMPTSRAIKKETCKQACSLFFYRLDWHFIHCFRVYYSITVATRPVYAPISRLRRSFAGIRKMPTSRAIKKETCKQACSLFFYRLDWHFIHCFRVYYSITVATRPDPTVHPPSRYFNIILPHIFYGFLSKIQ